MTAEEKVYSNDYAEIVALTGDLPPFGEDEAFAEYVGNYAIMHIPRALLASLNIYTQGYEPYVLSLCRDYLADAGIDRVLAQASLNVSGSGVLVGVVDTGINYTYPNFIYPNGTTRIAACWDQTDRTGTPPEGRVYGSVITREEINSALEEQRPLNLDDPSGHGTRLAAAALGAAPDAELVVVKLKQAKPYIMEENLFEDALAFQSNDLMTGLDFVVSTAQKLGRPVSVIIGLGTSQGAHGGLSFLERYIEALAQQTGVCITAAAGNEGLSRHHYYAKPVLERHTIEIAADGSEGFTLWLWNDYLCRTSVGVVTPLSEVIQPVQPVNMALSRFSPVLGSGEVSILYHFPVNEKQLTVVGIKKPVNGIWRLELTFSRTSVCSLDCWLPTDRLLNGNVTFASPSTATTVTVPAAAAQIITVGGYNGNTGGVYEFTGRGPNSSGIMRPDLTAPAVDVEGASGTSMAAAVTAGAAALLLQWGIVNKNDMRMKTEIIKAYLIAGTEQPVRNLESDGEGFPNDLWGYGRLNLYNTFLRIF